MTPDTTPGTLSPAEPKLCKESVQYALNKLELENTRLRRQITQACEALLPQPDESWGNGSKEADYFKRIKQARKILDEGSESEHLKQKDVPVITGEPLESHQVVTTDVLRESKSAHTARLAELNLALQNHNTRLRQEANKAWTELNKYAAALADERAKLLDRDKRLRMIEPYLLSLWSVGEITPSEIRRAADLCNLDLPLE